jgi:hypothetical protein
MKFRIVQLIHNLGDLQLDYKKSSIEYVIEKKNFLGKWKEIFVKELDTQRISHKTYADAEAYMIVNYMGDGMCKRIGNVYEYERYTYPIL